MLMYLPELLYGYVKNDEKYHQMANEYTEKILKNEDFINIIGAYANENPLIKELIDYVRIKLPKEHLLEYDVIINDDVSIFDSMYEKMNTETKIMYLYVYKNGDMSWNEEADKRNKQVIELYEKNILGKNVKCSEFIHVIYYFRKAYEMILKYTKRKMELKEYDKFHQEEQELFESIISLSDNESFKHIMFSKREQMYVLYMEFVGQMMHESSLVFDKIWEVVNNSDFKYNYFSYYKLSYYLIRFIDSFDIGDFELSKNSLDKIIELIDYAYNNKNDAVKSLNHYNKAFIDEFLMLSKFINDMVSVYMPNCFKKWGFLKNPNMKPIERAFYLGQLSNDEREIVKHFSNDDKLYSYKWLRAKIDSLKILDEFYS